MGFRKARVLLPLLRVEQRRNKQIYAVRLPLGVYATLARGVPVSTLIQSASKYKNPPFPVGREFTMYLCAHNPQNNEKLIRKFSTKLYEVPHTRIPRLADISALVLSSFALRRGDMATNRLQDRCDSNS